MCYRWWLFCRLFFVSCATGYAPTSARGTRDSGLSGSRIRNVRGCRGCELIFFPSRAVAALLGLFPSWFHPTEGPGWIGGLCTDAGAAVVRQLLGESSSMANDGCAFARKAGCKRIPRLSRWWGVVVRGVWILEIGRCTGGMLLLRCLLLVTRIQVWTCVRVRSAWAIQWDKTWL